MHRIVRLISRIWVLLFVVAFMAPVVARAAPYAAMVMDARTGEVLHARNADSRLHPASLTKMMTLYVVFEAVENGEISLDTLVTISRQAAAEPPSKLGLRAGQKIRLRYLIRAAAVKSANDASTALAFAIEGSEAAFARRMNRTAQALGMTRTTFRNAHGLTQEGHMSTARDMTILGRHLLYDYNEYYHLFSRTSIDAGVGRVASTNRRFLAAYRGADGIKTGYTRAAGFNLVASAERGSERIIATMFGGSSSSQRNARVAELLDMGFARAPSRARFNAPQRPAYAGRSGGGGGAKTIRVSGAVSRSLRPRARPTAPVTEPSPEVVASTAAINSALAEAVQLPETKPLIPTAPGEGPRARPGSLVVAASATAAVAPLDPQVVARLSTSGGHHWGINIGRYTTKYEAERVLLRVALNEMDSLEGARRRVMSSPRGHDATFMGLSRERAELACRRLQAKGTTCFMVSP